MNIFFREIRAYRKGLLFWCLGLIALIGSGMAKCATMNNTGQSMTDMVAMFPQSIQAIFGLTGFDLNKASGYFGILFAYIALMATVHAVMIGADIMSKEERDRTSEFLFVKPISRSKVVTAKILSGMFCLAIINVVTLISSIYFVSIFTKGDSFNNEILILMVGLFILQMLFFFVGTAIAAIHKKPKTSPSIATAILLATFIMSFLINVNEKIDFLKYITPFKYFDAKDIIANNSLDLVYLVISTILIIIMIFMTYVYFYKRDLSI